LQSLTGNSTDMSAWCTWLFATVKFALVAATILWLLFCYGSALLKKRPS